MRILIQESGTLSFHLFSLAHQQVRRSFRLFSRETFERCSIHVILVGPDPVFTCVLQNPFGLARAARLGVVGHKDHTRAIDEEFAKKHGPAHVHPNGLRSWWKKTFEMG